MSLLSEKPTEAEILTQIERALDAKFEVDKWHGDMQRLYIRMGGQNARLVNPSLREFIHAPAQHDDCEEEKRYREGM